MAQRRPRVKDYTIGWICAVTIELIAAAEILDEEYEGEPEDLPWNDNDSNLYTFGRIGEHYVVIACLPEGVYGKGSAATVASQMRLRFGSIRFGLMVGIGGGVPSALADVRLGDVVISKPQGQHGGVIQYNLGKTLAGDQFERKSFLNAPPVVLLNALSKFQLKCARGKDNLSAHLGKIARQPAFAPEKRGPDILFEPTYDHLKGQPTCEQCSRKQSVEREPREGEGVAVHYGTIASGDQVMKDGVTRDRISKELGGVLCFEMEAAGLMNSFPCLVIRGICDYADMHKNKGWQPYAAATAAACAKEILSVVPAAEVAKTQIVDEALRDKGNSAKDQNVSTQAEQKRLVGADVHN